LFKAATTSQTFRREFIMDKDDIRKNRYRSNMGDLDSNKSANDLDQLSNRLGNKMDDFQDEEGFLYPVVDTDICVGCMRCMKVCPMK